MKKNYSTFSFGKGLQMVMLMVFTMFAANSYAQLTCVGGSPTSPGANYSISCSAFAPIAAASVSTDNGTGTVAIESLGGTAIANTLAGLSPFIGKVVKVSVTVGTNSCWGYVLIEDKQAPSIVCPTNVTLACDQAGLLLTPAVTGQFTGATNVFAGTLRAGSTNGSTDECSKFEQSFVDAGVIAPCTGGTITRTWRLKDVWGNTSVTCAQTITVNPSPAFVAPTFTDATLQCQNVTAAQKATLLAGGVITGVVLPAVSTTCGLSLNFVSSREIPVCAGGYKIIRRYEVINMCPKVGELMVNGPYEQTIQVLDQTAPTGSTTYQNYGTLAGNYCFYMQGMLMTSQPTQQITALVPVTSAFSATTIQLTPRADENMCRAAQIIFTVTGSDLNCSNGNVVWTSNDSRIRLNGATSVTTAGGATVTVTGFIMQSQGTTFTIFATDLCGNVSSQAYNVNIVDNVSPQPVCIEEHRATLNSNGTVRVYAQTFNNRSSDNCGIERMHVRRMDKRNPVTSTATPCDYTTVATSTSCTSADIRDYFNDYVDFDCGDAGRTDVMVQVRYIDAAGNFSDCMVNVTVDDKTTPICVSPQPISRLCNEADLINYRALFTPPAAYDNCGIASTTNDDLPLALGCGTTSVTRTWTFTDCTGNSTRCSQTLTVTPKLGFTVPRIADEVKSCALGTTDIATILENDRRTIINGATLTGTSTAGGNTNTCSAPVVETEFWKFSSSQYCQIYRIRYTILDRCDPFYDYSPAPLVAGNCGVMYQNGVTPGQYFYFGTGNAACTQITSASFGANNTKHIVIYERFITINDTEAPVAGDLPAINICDGSTTDLDADACEGGVDVTLTGSDNCGTGGTAASDPTKLYYTWRAVRTSDNTLFTSGSTTLVSLRNLVLGQSYTVFYRLTDLCGNISGEKNFTVLVRDCKAPEILLHVKIIELGGQPNTPASGMARLFYEDIKNRITDNCGTINLTNSNKIVMEKGGVTTATAPASTTPNFATGLMYGCSELGLNKVRVWAQDDAGNWNYGVTDITVTDNIGICRPTAMIRGTVGTENNSIVKDVAVTANLSGVISGSATTAAAGTYEIGNLAAGTNYQVRATKTLDNDKKNGVTTLDIALISKHNLGTELLATPYKMIAADVDRNGDVDATDMLHIRRFILGITPSLPAGTAWRFIDKSYAFRNPSNPFGEDFSEVVNLTSVPVGTTAANFLAVKLGDVNNSYDATTVRGSRALTFNANDMNVVAGNEYTVAINADNFNAAAFQGTFAFEGATVKAVKAGNLNNVSDNSFGMFANAVSASWNGKSETSANVLNITFVAAKSGKLSEMLTVNSAITMAEGYDAAGNAMNVSLKFNTGKVAGGEFALYQNSPNPVALSTKIGFNLPKDGQAKLTIYTAEGKVLSVINNGYKAGYNEVSINKSDLNASGMLYYRLDTQDNSSTRKMIIIE
jgi:hypothetical protein